MSVSACPAESEGFVGETVKPIKAGGNALIVTGTSCDTVFDENDALAGHVAVTVITALPAETPVTTPVGCTVAVAGLFVPKVMVADGAPAGCTAETTICCWLPTFTCTVIG